MPLMKQSRLADRYDVIVRELADSEFKGDLIAARISSDNALTAIALGKLGWKTGRPEINPDYQMSLAKILAHSDNVRDTTNEILNASCAIIRETAAKDAGVVYTPAPVARYMCAKAIESCLIGKLENSLLQNPASLNALIDSSDRHVLERLQTELDHLRLIDTSCGTGIFLESAVEELCRLKSAISRRLGETPVPWHVCAREILAKNIFGLDIEAYSVKTARSRLLMLLASAGADQTAGSTDVKMNLYQGNALLAGDNGLLSANFDILVGNPPYMRVKSMFRDAGMAEGKRKKLDFAKAIQTSGLYHCQEGNLNLYKLFIERNLSLLREQGSMCLIFPSSFLNETTSERLRKQIFSNYAVEEVLEIPERSRAVRWRQPVHLHFHLPKGCASECTQGKAGCRNRQPGKLPGHHH